ncbi:MAG TPA: hypothetical protein VLI93_04835 [Acetobacteraceae bacterium]|nr:hypothetical protein [Acetobacteraceae bacterium]
MTDATELRAKAYELLAAAATTHDLYVAMLLRDVAAEFAAEAAAEDRRTRRPETRRCA